MNKAIDFICATRTCFWGVCLCVILALTACKFQEHSGKPQYSEETISFRRSYIGHEGMDSTAFDSLQASNPMLMPHGEQSFRLLERLEKAGLAKGVELLHKKFHDESKASSSLQLARNGDTINFDIRYSSQLSSYVLELEHHGKKSIQKLAGPALCTKKDLYKGGFEEILLLQESYIANGDNYDLTVIRIL